MAWLPWQRLRRLTLAWSHPRLSKSSTESETAGDPGVDAALSTTATTDDDSRQLREALRRALGTAKDTLPPSPHSNWRDSWQTLADLGLPALCVPEERGGFGARVDVAVAAAMELGAALHGAPFAGLTASAYALTSVSGDTEDDEVLSRILSGESICAFGQLEAGANVARLIDGATDSDALVLLDRSADSILVLSDPSEWTSDGPRHAFDVSRTWADVTVKAGAGRRLLKSGHVAELYRLLLSADAVGGVQHMIDQTVAYCAQRTTFGRPIGGFQAVQHRLVDHTLRARGMALLVGAAARLLAEDSPQASRHVAMAEVSVSAGAAHILHDLLQLTGAIGFTWEYGLHYYERRVHQDARLVANPRAAVRSLAHAEGWTDAR